MEVGGFFLKQEYQDAGIVDKSLALNFVKTLSKILICPRGFLQPQHPVLNAYSFLILESLVAEPPHAAKAVEVDGLELVVENPYNLILGKNRRNRGWCF